MVPTIYVIEIVCDCNAHLFCLQKEYDMTYPEFKSKFVKKRLGTTKLGGADVDIIEM